MTNIPGASARHLFIDKAAIQKIVAEEHKRRGIPPDPTATGEKAQAMMRARGIKPEDNILSSGIIAARDEQ
jgi:hypothetical protein